MPGRFSIGAATSHRVLPGPLIYSSFVISAGLGLGDMVPTNAVGERFVILLSVASTLDVALLVGLLLGRFIASEEVEMLEEQELGPDEG